MKASVAVAQAPSGALLSVQGLSKAFGGIRAVDAVSFALAAGERGRTISLVVSYCLHWIPPLVNRAGMLPLRSAES